RASHRRRRRVTLWIVLALLVIIPVAHFLWGKYEHRRLESSIRTYRDAGQPVLMEDFNSPARPDQGGGDDPLPAWRAAARLVDLATPEDWPEWLDAVNPRFPLTS